MSVKNFLPGKKKGIDKKPKKARKRGGAGSTFRDFRGIDGVVDDAVGNSNRSLQERDMPKR